ncbi:MAG: GntR family transcriptional regulator [Propionibacteriaceae bacterium]
MSEDDESLVSQIYITIREQIIHGTHPAGSRLRERELAEELAVSRIPVREALVQLAADGFIITYPRRGAVVRQLTLRDIAELFDIRSSLEVFSARQAAAAVKAGADRQPLLEALQEADRATAAQDEDAIAISNAALHEVIVATTGNSLLRDLMRPISGRTRWLFRLTSDRSPVEQQHEHHELFQAILAGDIEMAGAVAYAHIERGRRPSLESLASVLPTGE